MKTDNENKESQPVDSGVNNQSVQSVGQPTVMEMIEHVQKLSLAANDIIVIYEMDVVPVSNVNQLRMALNDVGIKNFLLVVNKNNAVIGKMSTEDLVRVIRATIDSKDNPLDWYKHGLIKVDDVKRLMNEQSFHPDKRAMDIINMFVEKWSDRKHD